MRPPSEFGSGKSYGVCNGLVVGVGDEWWARRQTRCD